MLAVMLPLVIAIPVVGGLRYNDCDSSGKSAKTTDNDSATNYTAPLALVVSHNLFDGIVLLMDWVLRIVLIRMCKKSVISEWKESGVDNNTKFDNNYTPNEESELVVTKAYNLYVNYVDVGTRTTKMRNILKQWFVLQYSVYILSVLVELVHIIRPIVGMDPKRPSLDTIHSILHLFFDSLAFLVPYILGTMLNNAHHKYYEKMMEKYFEVRINGESCRLGEVKESVRGPYMKYYHEATRNRDLLVLNTEFDFVPSLFDIDIPLDSPGYTFSILIAIASVVFNFTAI